MGKHDRDPAVAHVSRRSAMECVVWAGTNLI